MSKVYSDDQTSEASERNLKFWLWTRRISILWVVFFVVVIVIPTVVYTQWQLYDLRSKNELIEMMSSSLKFNEEDLSQVQDQLDKLGKLAEKNPEMKKMAIFYLIKMPMLQILEKDEAYKETVIEGVRNLRDQPYELYAAISTLSNKYQKIDLDGQKIDLNACASELNERYEPLEAELGGERMNFRIWLILNEMGYPGWGVETCSQLR